MSECYVTSTLAEELSQFLACILLNINYFPGNLGPVEGQSSLVILADGHYFLRSEKTNILIENDLAQIVCDQPKHKVFDYGLQCPEDVNGAWPSFLDESDKSFGLRIGKGMITPN